MLENNDIKLLHELFYSNKISKKYTYHIQKLKTNLEKLISQNKKICKAVDLLSRRKGEKYNHYIDRLKDNNLAVTVKLADLIDNFSRRKGYKKASKVDLQKIKKYKKAYKRLTGEKLQIN